MNLMFQPQFEPLIVSGRKPHTIRPKRKIPLRVGQTLSLRVWTGKPYRSPQREFLRASVEDVKPIVIGRERIVLNGVQLTRPQSDNLAMHDGFASFKEMRRWFDKNHGETAFIGEIIFWKKL